MDNLKTKIARFLKLNPTQAIVVGFFLIILLGAFLLTLPISSRDGEATNFLDSFFTATSATCVTGLITFDTYSHWSGFGQIVILALIQVGGLGFMTMFTILSFLLKRTISMKERLVLMQSVNLNSMTGIVRLTKHILIATFTFEGAGALVLSLRFMKDFGFIGGIKKGVFHAVSAFCNAGFDLMGEKEPFSSLTYYHDDIVVNIVIMALIIIGGLGFFVWEDIYTNKSFSKLNLYSKIVLGGTAFLIISGAVLVFAFEYDNPATLENMSAEGKILSSFFQSVTTRTAGYNTINLADMSQPTKVISCIWMFIGGASGSTAGGIKVVTIVVLILAVKEYSKGNTTVSVSGRSIPNGEILRALTIFFMGALMVGISSVLIMWVDNVPAIDAFFECFSAFGTVGLTTGITPDLSIFSKIILIILMFFGRVGILTITLSLSVKARRKKANLQYPEAKVLIG